MEFSLIPREREKGCVPVCASEDGREEREYRKPVGQGGLMEKIFT